MDDSTSNTASDRTLSQEQLDHYWEHGYTVAPRLLDPGAIAVWLQRQEHEASLT